MRHNNGCTVRAIKGLVDVVLSKGDSQFEKNFLALPVGHYVAHDLAEKIVDYLCLTQKDKLFRTFLAISPQRRAFVMNMAKRVLGEIAEFTEFYACISRESDDNKFLLHHLSEKFFNYRSRENWQRYIMKPEKEETDEKKSASREVAGDR